MILFWLLFGLWWNSTKVQQISMALQNVKVITIEDIRQAKLL